MKLTMRFNTACIALFQTTLLVCITPFIVFSNVYAEESKHPIGTPVVANTTKPAPSQPVEPTPVAADNKETLTEEEEEQDPLLQAIQKLKLESSKLSLENSIVSAQQKQQLQALEAEKEQIEAELALNLKRLKKTLEKQEAEKDTLTLKNDLQTAQEIAANAEVRSAISRLELQQSLREQQQNLELLGLNQEYYKLSRENALLSEQQKTETLALSLKTTRLNHELMQLKFSQFKRDDKLDLMTYIINQRKLEDSLKSIADIKQDYLLDPVVDDYLIISDRKIDMGGLILRGTADFVTKRIHFFNNQSEEYPIFLIIGESPGGSVMEGMKIIKAMRASHAPVYVVVKAYAASMAAAITTLADKSFALPDAIILHHQVSGVSTGTVSQLEEQLKTAQEWSQRLLTPVAQKMNISLDDFIQKMYQHNSAGDWNVFADKAVQLKWVDQIVKGIRDTSYLNRPDKNEKQPWVYFAQAEKQDTQGLRYIELPHLMPFDVYHLFNPNNYYRYR